MIFNPLMAEDFIFSASNNYPLNNDIKTIIFIHGSPGNHKAFKKYLNDKDIKENFNLIVIDRPGFGKSKKYDHQPNMIEQAKTISDHLQYKYKANDLKKKLFIFSHSYGAPLSILISEYFDIEPNLILVSGPYNPDYNMKRWYNYMADLPIFRSLIGSSWRASNEEMLELNKDLEKVKNQLNFFKGKTYFIHGRKDGLVNIKHSKWAHKLRQDLKLETELFEYSSNHFIIWNNFEKMKKLILEII